MYRFKLGGDMARPNSIHLETWPPQTDNDSNQFAEARFLESCGGCCSAGDAERRLRAREPRSVSGLLRASRLIFGNRPSGACTFLVRVRVCSTCLYDLQIRMSQEWPL